MGHVISATKEMLTVDVTAPIGLVEKGVLLIDKAADVIAEQLKLHPNYTHGDAELRKIVENLQSLPAGTLDEKKADFYATIEWLKDWGDHGDRLLVIDDTEDPYHTDGPIGQW